MTIILSLIASILIIVAQAIYILQIIQRKIKPSILSWFGWLLLMGITLLSQIIEDGWDISQIGFVIAEVGCFLIVLISFVLKQYNFKKPDLIYLFLGLACMFIYLFSHDSWMTTLSAICADLIIAIPILTKSYSDPESERSIAWPIGFFSWIISLYLSLKGGAIYMLFPAYVVFFYIVMLGLTYRKSTVK